MGCGSRGRAHGRAYLTHPRTTLVALCDLDAGRLQALGTELGVERRYADLDAMLAAEAPDIVAIPTATEFHFPLAMRCLEHGCHIDVEKPICEHLDQADALLAAARRRNREIAVHHQWRVGPPSAAVLAALQEGRIGALRYLYASGKGYYGGYGLPNIGTHLLNQLFAVTGRVRSVSGHVLTDGRAIGPHDVLQAPMGMGIVAGENITALLEFENGVCATLLQHRFERIDLSAHVVEIYGTEGRLLWRPHGAFWLPTPNIPPGPNIATPPYDNAHWEALPLTPPTAWPATDACNVDEFGFVEQYVAAVRDESGMFDPSDSSSVVPPMAVAAFSLRGVLDDLGIPRGTLHTAQEMSFLGEVSVGETMSCTASIAQNAVRGALRFIAVVMDVHGADQSIVMTAKSTIVTPV